MHSFTLPVAALAAIAAIPAVNAHGFVSGVVSGGKWYAGASPQWFYFPTKPQQAGWYAYNQDLGFVSPSEYGSENITCHNGATPGTTTIPVTAGSSIDLQWSTWPDSHHGPVISYLARCNNGDCTKVDKSTLNFFKVDAGGLESDTTVPGTWATDKLIANNNTWTMTIPSGLSGHFVLRHEIIALHSAGSKDGAQNYPMCLNLEISGSGTEHPCTAGAVCKKGPALYTESDAGILINIYQTLSSYTIPGPKIWSGLKKRVAMAFSA